MYGFRFTTDMIDKHTSDFECLYVKTLSLPGKAQKRYSEEGVPQMNGSHKFDYGYQDKTPEFQLTLVENNFKLRRRKMREITSWLNGKGKLILDYEPDKYYSAEVFSEILPDIEVNNDVFNVAFVCDPCQYSVFDNGDIKLDDPVPLDMPIKLSEKTQFDIIHNTTVTITNYGTYEAYPIIEIAGTADSITVGDFTVSNITEKVYVDRENYLCYTLDADGDKINKMLDFSGDFIEIQPGENEINITGTSLAASVYFNFRNTYL